jgi:hypothetical protein
VLVQLLLSAEGVMWAFKNQVLTLAEEPGEYYVSTFPGASRAVIPRILYGQIISRPGNDACYLWSCTLHNLRLVAVDGEEELEAASHFYPELICGVPPRQILRLAPHLPKGDSSVPGASSRDLSRHP